MKLPQTNHDWQFDVEQQFYELINGKSVAVVSPAPIVRQLTMGDEIDGHDTVVRIHRCYPEYSWREDEGFLPAVLQRKVGSTTDIFYTSGFGGPPIEWVSGLMTSFFEAGGAIFCSQEALLSNYDVHALGEFIKAGLGPIRTLSHVDFALFKQMTGFYPLPGTRIVLDVLRYKPSRATLIGFPCYVSEDKPLGVRDHNPAHRYETKRDFNFIRQLWRENEKLHVDPITEHLFNTINDEVHP